MKNTEIKKVYARQILDSRGNPTVEAEVIQHLSEQHHETDRYGIASRLC